MPILRPFTLPRTHLEWHGTTNQYWLAPKAIIKHMHGLDWDLDGKWGWVRKIWVPEGPKVHKCQFWDHLLFLGPTLSDMAPQSLLLHLLSMGINEHDHCGDSGNFQLDGNPQQGHTYIYKLDKGCSANTSYNNAHHGTNGSNQPPQLLYSVLLVVESN